ncbi:CBM9 family sugar-binding protein [Winogradskyella sp. A3E31]|uniref:CBM9 family sugar-binding protein n=1 Tax=Winogradskyella sp. A3E31 TaxID=3349637 RepID=UPI00398ADD4C
MKNKIFSACLLSLLLLKFNCKNKEESNAMETIGNETTKTEKQLITINKAKDIITIDGIADEPVWQKATWQPLDQVWLGDSLTSDDFSGRYKLTWDKDTLYLLAEIQDDTLIDIYKDPLKQWWDDDCLEVFIDEDNSGGEHQFNHNAFAYHIALDGNVVDMSTEQEGKLYNSHVESKRITENNTSTWEVKIYLYDDSYDDANNLNEPVKLTLNKKIGFALAYCDNDHSETREHFIGSIPVEGADKNRGWIDADIFGTLLLKGD